MALLRKSSQFIRYLGNYNIVLRGLTNLTLKQSPIPPPTFLQSKLDNSWIYNEKQRISIPQQINPFILPIKEGIWLPLDEPSTNKIEKIIEEPATQTEDNEIRVERLIIIRRKKMKKHKLRKLRKRMKYEVAKIRQRREYKKEKDFHAELIGQCKAGEMFSAEDYVQERLNIYRQVMQDNAEREAKRKASMKVKREFILK